MRRRRKRSRRSEECLKKNQKGRERIENDKELDRAHRK